MGYAAARTTTLRLIPNIVVLPYRNPFVVAKSGATLDLLSGGRFTLAVGVGYLKREFAALGRGLRGARRAVRRSARRRSGRSGPPMTSRSRASTSAPSGITAHPRPVSDPHPPIWIGGNTGAARRRVAAEGRRLVPVPRAGRAGPDRAHRDHRLGARPWPTASTTCAADSTKRAGTPRRSTWSSRNFDGGSPADDDFNADAYLTGLEKLAKLGVTWVQVGVAGRQSGARAGSHRAVQDPGDRRSLRRCGCG